MAAGRGKSGGKELFTSEILLKRKVGFYGEGVGGWVERRLVN